MKTVFHSKFVIRAIVATSSRPARLKGGIDDISPADWNKEKERSHQMIKILALTVLAALPFGAYAAGMDTFDKQGNYNGSFPTTALYKMCSEQNTHDECNIFIQGMMYGIKSHMDLMRQNKLSFCPFEISNENIEQARKRILGIIDDSTRETRQATEMAEIGWRFLDC